MSGFDEDFALIVEDHFRRFGRTITFHPAGGEERSVEVIFDEVEHDARAEEFRESEREELWVEVRRNDEHANGGIRFPRMGDWFNHPDEGDDPTPFVYQGRKRNVNATTWELLYARPIHEGRGLVSGQG